MLKKLVFFLCMTFILFSLQSQAETDYRPYYKAGIEKTQVKQEMLLALMQFDLMDGIQEAFGYMLLDDIEEKGDFYKRMYRFDLRAAKFRKIAGIGMPGREKFSHEFELIVAEKHKLQLSARNMFKAYEKNKKIDRPTVIEFENSVDEVSSYFNTLVEDFVAKRDFTGNEIQKNLIILTFMRSDMLEAIEEAFAYIVLSDRSEKRDFEERVRDFENLAGKLSRSIKRLDNDTTQAYSKMIKTKDELLLSIKNLHDDFEKKGSVTKHDIRDVEDKVHKFKFAYVKLFHEYMDVLR